MFKIDLNNSNCIFFIQVSVININSIKFLLRGDRQNIAIVILSIIFLLHKK